ncbi:MAG: glycosyl hydrolase family protein [Clostridium sp.]|nr:glycosyl hydrolase family protein [Clostridium sp.]
MKNIRNKIKLVLATALMGGLLATNASAATINSHFSDAFDYQTSRFEKANGYSNGDMFDCIWRANNVNFNGGLMNIGITRDYGSNYKYAGGEYRTKDKFGYGLYQVRMKPAKNVGIVSSFFTYTGPTDGTPWDEIDIEFLGKNTNQVQFNYYTNGVGKHEHLYNLGFDASQSFHTYGFNWQRNYIAWLVDGKEVYRAYNNIPSHPGKMMMNVWPGTNVDTWLGHFNGATPLTAQYDWISYDPM